MSCNLCGNHDLKLLIGFGSHPIAHRLLVSPDEEEYTHPVNLCFCDSCGLIQLDDPIPPEELYTEYNWLSSWKWNPHVPRLIWMIENLLERIDKDSLIVEVGSNDGSFLEALREEGFKNLVGIEPAEDAQKASRARGIDTIGSYFTKETADRLVGERGPCDLFISRQTLEHVGDIQTFQTAMQTVLRPGGYALIEVPNFDLALRTPDYSTVWEEHTNYFVPETLDRFLEMSGIRVFKTESAVFSGEALYSIGEYIGPPQEPVSFACSDALRSSAMRYAEEWPEFKAAFAEYLKACGKDNKKVVVYGGGCRSSSLINFAGVGEEIDLIVDDQLEKQGRFLPGSRIPILAGDALPKQDLGVCVLSVNAENEEKVLDRRKDDLEGSGAVVSMHPPSDKLPSFWGQFGEDGRS